MWPKGAHLILAVSGGADSMALLHVLCRRQEKDGLRLTLAHLHHGIRVRAADRDSEFVRRAAAALQLPFVAERVDVPARAAATGESLEMAARAARYDFFRRLARKLGAHAVATAHTADDQAETLLLRLLRGSGLQGLGGMAPVTQIGGLKIVRPLLDVERKEIESFLRQRAIAWREDATNRDPAYLRNRVRRRLIPLLEKEFQPAIRRLLCRTASVLREEEELLEPLIRRAVARAQCADGTLSLAALRALQPALRHRVLLAWLRKSGVPDARLGYGAVARVEALLSRGGELELIRGVHVVADRSALSVVKGERAAPRERPRAARLPVPGAVEWGAFRIAATEGLGIHRPPRGKVGSVPSEATVRLPKKGEHFTVRSWRAGDRIAPWGMSGSLKLQDLFVDQKVPLANRAHIPVVTCGNVVVWVPGHRVSRDWAVPDETAPSVRLRVEAK